MNELREILDAVADDGISDDRLEEIAAVHALLGRVLNSARSPAGLSAALAQEAREFLATQERGWQ